MKHEELEQLLWEEAEGVLTAAGRERLARLMDRAVEGAQRRAEIAAASEALSRLPRVEPPAEMYESIQTAVCARERERERVRDGRRRSPATTALERTWTSIVGAWSVRYTYGLAGVLVGLMVAVVLVPSRSARERSDDAYYLGALTGKAMPASPLTFADGLLELRREGDTILATLAGAGETGALEISFEQPGRRLSLTHRDAEPVEVRFDATSGLPVGVRLASPRGTVFQREFQLNEIPAR